MPDQDTYPGDQLPMIWQRSNRADPKPRALADRHYNRQKIGTAQFVPPGSCVVLYAETTQGKAFWITSAPFPQYVKHAWPGAWVCSAFRNEGAGTASQLIRQAIAASVHHYGAAPERGMVTFVDATKVNPIIVRGRPRWGWSFEKAGFVQCGITAGGLIAFLLSADDMPAPRPAVDTRTILEAA